MTSRRRKKQVECGSFINNVRKKRAATFKVTLLGVKSEQVGGVLVAHCASTTVKEKKFSRETQKYETNGSVRRERKGRWV